MRQGLKEQKAYLSRARSIYLKARQEKQDDEWAIDDACDATYSGVLSMWAEYGLYQRWKVGQHQVREVNDDWRRRQWRHMVAAQAATWEEEFQQYGKRLADLKLMEARQKDLLDQAIAEYSDNPAPGTANAYSICYKAWSDANQRLTDFVGLSNQHHERQEKQQDFAAIKRKKYKAIYAEYQGKGEVYALLCERAASAYATLELLEAEGRTSGPEHNHAANDLLSLISQIQKHTESLKTEVQESHLHEFGDRILKVVERHLSNQPLIMKRIVSDIEGERWELDDAKLIEAS